jgi:hypothetical protein
MSAVIGGEGMPLAVLVDDLIRDLMDFQLWLVRTTIQEIAQQAFEP